MSTLVLRMSASLDGFVAAADGDGTWNAAGRSPDSGAYAAETIRGASAHLVGATTYASMSAFWPQQTGPIAEAMNDLPKVVFSDSLASADWGPATIASGDLAASVARLKAEHPDGYLLAHGGVRFVRSLVAADLVDEYRLFVHPVVLGAGERIFDGRLDLVPVSTTAFSGSCVAHVFTRA